MTILPMMSQKLLPRCKNSTGKNRLQPAIVAIGDRIAICLPSDIISIIRRSVISELYYSKMLGDMVISKKYLEKHTSKQFAKEEILESLRKLELSGVAMAKYQEFVQKFANSDIPYPDCGSCNGLPR